MTGNAQKGPFITGSTIQVFPLDDSLAPVGTVYPSQISDDLGLFEVSFPTAEPFVEVVADGFYYDELTAGLSGAPLTLRAIAPVEAATDLRVNLLTTIAESRLRTLVGQHESYTNASEQAKNELFAAFDIDGTSLGDLTAMDLTGTSPDDAALIATSAILLNHAATHSTDSGNRVAVLSLTISQMSIDLQDGALSPSMSNELVRAAHFLDAATVQQNLQSIYGALGLTISVPALDGYVEPLASRYPWSRRLPGFPTSEPDRCTASCVLGTKIYFAGGTCNPTTDGTTDFYESDTMTGLVIQRAAMPTAREGAGCIGLGGKVYVMGGQSDAEPMGSSKVDAYDPATDTWTELQMSPRAPYNPTLVAVGDSIEMVGGYSQLTGFSASVDRFDPSTDSWSSLPPMSTARGWPAACTLDGKLYVFGGAQSAPQPLGQISLSSVEVFDSATWSARSPMTTARYGFGCAAIGATLYVMGGPASTDNAAYDPANDAWTPRTPMDEPILNSIELMVVNDRIFVVGYDQLGPTIRRYDPANEPQ